MINPELIPGPETFPGFVASATRQFQLADSDADAPMTDLSVSGIQFESEDSAEAYVDQLSRALPDAMDATLRAGHETQATGVSQSQSNQNTNGVERQILGLTLTFDDAATTRESIAAVLVRKGEIVQLAIARGTEDAKEPLLDLVDALDERWPASDLWALVPTIDDVPAGMEVVSETTQP